MGQLALTEQRGPERPRVPEQAHGAASEIPRGSVCCAVSCVFTSAAVTLSPEVGTEELTGVFSLSLFLKCLYLKFSLGPAVVNSPVFQLREVISLRITFPVPSTLSTLTTYSYPKRGTLSGIRVTA